ncbi:hypothetical protein LK09_17455 [Microbacterium mangrovi]|uniref:SbsA Ig-like domain-containing protein n=1 Tax=Microbacterium mangrovi TaxID=1348253 RepID=A0A0B2A223_9MICO|nr:hypothetical protein [Microbacterium mangrovi]KHK95819.1 hypothetical protein LK09_17455 [Microbacterium mangrovi]
MSTEPASRSRRASSRRRRGRAFVVTLVSVAAVLGILGLSGAVASSVQGPRVTAVQVDPQAAVAASGSRLIVTTNQSLEKIKPSQVQVTPAAAFTVDTAGRSAGVRFTLPLHEDTSYTVRVRDVAGLGGGPKTTITETFRTPRLSLYLLRRGAGTDTIYRTNLASDALTPVYTHPHIEDFRATSDHLVVSVLDTHQHGQLLVTDLAGKHARRLRLPGVGNVTNMQSADRGDLIGFEWTDAVLGTPTSRENALYTISLRAPAGTAPSRVAVPGKDTRVADWRFVPDTDAILVLPYTGRMLLTASTGKDATDLGAGVDIEGIARGSSVAVVQRADGVFAIDLASGKQHRLAKAMASNGQPVRGSAGHIAPVPGVGGGTVRLFTLLGAGDRDEGTTAYRVTDTGAATPIFHVSGADAVMQTCVSPSARYAAILVDPNVVTDSYDTYLAPMPKHLVTHIVELSTGREVRQYPGFAASWCQLSPVAFQ